MRRACLLSWYRYSRISAALSSNKIKDGSLVFVLVTVQPKPLNEPTETGADCAAANAGESKKVPG